jgi:hypothetical protein
VMVDISEESIIFHLKEEPIAVELPKPSETEAA